jgi:CHAD domain-containing protein
VEPGELLFGAATDPGQVSDALSSRYQVRIEAPTVAHWICLDTADWRLHKAGMSLRDARHGRTGTLFLSDGAQDVTTAPSQRQHWPRRVDALSASRVRDRIAPAVGVRALLPLAEVDVRSFTLRVLDDEDKTRVRVKVDQQRLAGARQVPLPLRVLVSPLRGYERDGERCAELLTEAMSRMIGASDAAAAAFAAAGHRPGQPAVAPLQLDPAVAATESLAAVLRRWINIIDAVRPGVLADIDIEYLHEMRASIRATRSLLRLGAGLLPEGRTAHFAEEFRWLGRLTAPVRDLDVYLLDLAGQGDTDLTGLTDLEPLRRLVAGQRRRALAALRAGLESARGQALSASWHAALDDIAARDVPGPTARSAAAQFAHSAYRRIVKAARPVTDQTEPDHLHRLRRRCKRMRYLLEGYASVYEREPHREVLSALKSLQDCLGEIQDRDVQRRHIGELATALSRRSLAPETLLSMGALRDRTLHRDVETRRTMTRRLARFSGSKTRKQVAALASDES